VIALAALLLLLPAQGESIPLSDYKARLARIQAAVDGGDFAGASSGARELLRMRVHHDGMILLPDATVLGPLAEATSSPMAREAARRLPSLRAELEAVQDGPPPAAPDGVLLERLRQEELQRQVTPDKSVTGPVLHGPPELPKSFWEKLAAFGEWLEKIVQRFLRWLAQLFFGTAGAQTAGTPGTRYLVIGLVLVLVGTLAAVAVIALRKRREAPVAVSSAPPAAMSVEDADPLSRSAGEWERFAAELLRAGRFRESIRAWYHALLVSLFRAGTLHYRKDRTNWEYAYALPSTVAWRAGFVEATRTFEQEWYGRRDTPVETAEMYQSRMLRMLETVRGGNAG
jgi:hypothetical protein